jgi:hypothetical protein
MLREWSFHKEGMYGSQLMSTRKEESLMLMAMVLKIMSISLTISLTDTGSQIEWLMYQMMFTILSTVTTQVTKDLKSTLIHQRISLYILPKSLVSSNRVATLMMLNLHGILDLEMHLVRK